MANQFISPNWHPLLVHYPIAFLSFGILLEMFSLFWPRGYLRAAGRWMLLLGGLSTIPTLVVGLYALRQAMLPASPQPHLNTWYAISQASPWTPQQRNYMWWHVLLNSLGTVVAIATVAFWISARDMIRRHVHWLAVIGFIVAMGLFSVGAWFGGESVYRFGTSVQEPAPGSSAAQAMESHESHAGRADVEPGHGAAEESTAAHGIKWFIPPLELHLALAGLAVAVSVGALGLTIRRLERPIVEPIAEEPTTVQTTTTQTITTAPVRPKDPLAQDPLRDRTVIEQQSLGPYGTQTVAITEPPVIFAGRFWIFAFIVMLGTAVAGIWSVADALTASAIRNNLHELGESSHLRLLLHTIFGLTLLLLPLLLAGVARFGRRRRNITGGFLLLAVLVIGFQLWLGIAMLFDGHRGPIFGFNSAPAPGATSQPIAEK